MSGYRAKSFTTLLLGATAIAGGLAWANAQSAPPPTQHQCQTVLADVRVMGSELVTLDRALQEQVTRMQAAPDAERALAMESVIETMATQRRVILEQMKGTHQRMVVHLFGHVEADGGLSKCPILLYMKREPLTSGTAPVRGEMEY